MKYVPFSVSDEAVLLRIRILEVAATRRTFTAPRIHQLSLSRYGYSVEEIEEVLEEMVWKLYLTKDENEYRIGARGLFVWGVISEVLGSPPRYVQLKKNKTEVEG